MKIQESAENYLEAILVLGERQGNVRSVSYTHLTLPTKLEV